MQLLRLSEVPLRDQDRSFGYSRARALGGASLVLCAAALAIYLGNVTLSWLGYFIAGVIVIGLLLYHKAIIARFQSTNWLVRMTGDGLFIKFRSYLNAHFAADDHVVVFIPYSEIATAKLIHEVQRVADRDEDNRPTETTRKRRVVELELNGDSRQLAIAIASEQDTVLAKTRIGAERPSTRYHHFPVRLPTMKRLMIEWGVVPAADVFLDALTRHTLVRPAESATKDLTVNDTLTREDQENRLLELVESGQKLVAIAEARRLYAYNLTEAQSFIEELLHKNNARK
ncbi:MAG: hypothetical protein FJ145_16875 [Deltaproteobacteria bacterium]|nr:hypothetical protein [Deltaproteobacteria bacterium]